MKAKRKITLIIRILLIIIFLFGVYHFFEGRLNFLNHWVVGFDKIETDKAILYHHADKTDVISLSNIDSLIDIVEGFHNLHFQRKVDIVICNNRKEHARYVGHNGVFISQPFYGRIYIPYMEQFFEDEVNLLYIFILHELSHAVIYQNISISKLPGYPLWFMEGLATYSSNMMGVGGYTGRDTVYSRISEGYFIFPSDWGKLGLPLKGETVRQYPYHDVNLFAYSEFGYIIEDLIEKYGKPKLTELLQLSITKQKLVNAFMSVYEIGFDDYMTEFQDDILSSANIHSNGGIKSGYYDMKLKSDR